MPKTMQKSVDPAERICEEIKFLRKDIDHFFHYCDERNGILVGIEQNLGDISSKLENIVEQLRYIH